MSTIKRKVEMNLPQLIEWGFNNPELSKGKVYNIDDENDRFATYVSFLPDVTGVRVPCTITQNNTFTVEIEEQIDEDTKLKELFLITNNSNSSERYYNYSINDVLSNNEGYYEEIAMLILKPEPLIIWTKEEGLV
ncbi:hypothetical protein [Mammaliicoccus sp. G-M31]|uniref:hypothetical protein n=1 Tax=Mammaliicoccus sp. G-M31 TaxID=2898690 RepID=UPI001EFAAF01|nr:hypothetical protein [Mammaliicoccus sp. G-M31]